MPESKSNPEPQPSPAATTPVDPLMEQMSLTGEDSPSPDGDASAT